MEEVNCAVFRGSGQWFTLYSSILRCHTNRRTKVPGAGVIGGRVPCTTLTRVIVRLKPSDSLRRGRMAGIVVN